MEAVRRATSETYKDGVATLTNEAVSLKHGVQTTLNNLVAARLKLFAESVTGDHPALCTILTALGHVDGTFSTAVITDFKSLHTSHLFHITFALTQRSLPKQSTRGCWLMRHVVTLP